MAKYTLDNLHGKYQGFRAPSVKVSLGKRTLEAIGLKVRHVECETGVGMEASVCRIELDEVYDYKNSKFICENDLIRGMPAQVELGYITTIPVFYGFLYEVEYSFGMQNEPTVTLVCMDVKAAMMGCGTLDFYGGMSFKQVIQGFFSGNRARGYTTLCESPSIELPELNQPIPYLPEQMDDYKFLEFTVARFGLECFVRAGELLIRKEPESPEQLLKISPFDGIDQLQIKLRSAGYLKSVSVEGGSDQERDKDQKQIHGNATSTYSISNGNADARRLLGNRQLQLFAASVRDNSAAAQLAQGKLRRYSQLCSTLHLELFGLPELEPGYALELTKASPNLNGDWYIVSVTHKIDEAGFHTAVDARRKI